MPTELPDQNPFASPMTDERPAMPGAGNPRDVERIRRAYLNHEASIRSIGILYYLGAFMMAIYFIGAVYMSVSGADTGLLGIGIAALCGFLAAAQWWIAGGLRRLDRSVRPWAIAVSVLGLINIPVGTIISIYFIYLLASEKGKYVLSPEYQEIRAATPHIKYKTSWIVWVFLGLLVLALLLIVVAIISGQ